MFGVFLVSNKKETEVNLIITCLCINFIKVLIDYNK